MTLAVVVEGDTDLPYVRKLVSGAGLDVALEIDTNGKHQLDLAFAGYNGAAQGSPWLVVRDLDHDASCAGEFLEARAVRPNRWMRYRLAVREVEAWAMADAEGVADFFGVRLDRVPVDPDAEDDPTRALVALCRGSRRRRIRQDMVPPPGSRVAVGQLYEATLIEFGTEHWDLERAAARSPSLARARLRLGELAAAWRAYLVGAA